MLDAIVDAITPDGPPDAAPPLQNYDPHRIASREQLIGMLGEAAEVEHNLMLTYLYAAFSLKRGEDEGLSPEQVEALAEWRATTIRIAVEEMGHLAIVCNLLCAVGGAPHFGRLNFPIAPGPLPAEMSVRLRRFDLDTLDHFIFLERPEGSDAEDSAPFHSERSYRRAPIEQSHLMPVAMDYPTVGALYDRIVEMMEILCGRYGESDLFVGDASRQVGPELTPLPGLRTVTCLKSAVEAIDTIKEQGEGSDADAENSHFKRFCAIRGEYETFLEDDPAFDPARPVAENPVMRSPPTPDGLVWVTAPDAAVLMDWCNALYVHMLRLLAQTFGRPGPAHEKRVLLNAATDLMYAMTPAAEAMTRLPAKADGSADCTAGMSFATVRDAAPLPTGTEWRVIICRFKEISDASHAVEALSKEGMGDGPAASARMVRSIADTFVAEAVAILELCDGGEHCGEEAVMEKYVEAAE